MAEESNLASNSYWSTPLGGAKETERPAQAPATAPTSSPATTPVEAGNKPSWSDIGEDVKKSIAAKGTQGAVGTLIGGLGSLESFAAEDLPTLAKNITGWGAEKVGAISPETRKEWSSTPIYSNQTEEQKKGTVSPLLGIPTYKGVVEHLQSTPKDSDKSWVAYDPKTSAGKVAGAAAEFGSQGIPGGVRSLLGRVVTSAAAGAGSELAGQSVKEGSEAEPYARLTGALAGAGTGAVGGALVGRAFNAVRAAALPTGVAEREIADALAKDVSRGQANLTLLKQEGATLADIGGPETRRLLEQSGAKSVKNEPLIAAYNQHLNERAAEVGDRVANHLTNTFKQEVNAGQLTQALEEAGKKSRNDIYGLLAKNPSANAIDHTRFGDLTNRPIMQSAMKSAEENAANFPDWNIVVPRGGSTPAQGNLAYWDQVKRELDSKIRSTTDSVERNAAIQAKSKLVNTLDNSVAGYANARAAAADTFRAESAPEAGMNFFKNMNSIKLKEATDAHKAFSPEQQRLFGMGFAQQIQDQVQSGNIAGVAKKFAADDIFRQKAKLALGKDAYAQLEATILAENVASKVKALKFLGRPDQYAGVKNLGINSVGGVAAAAALEGFMTGQFLSPAGALTGAGVGALNSLKNMFGTFAERRVAEKIIPMAFSKDPKVMKQFADALQESSQARAVMKKLAEQFDRKTATATSSAIAFDRGEPQRATGGRIGRATGGKIDVNHEREADMLMRRVEAAKKLENHNTERLLQKDDSVIAKALAKANKDI